MGSGSTSWWTCLGERTAIELEYSIRRFTAVVHDELPDLPTQGAHDISRYDFVKDIVRVETCIRIGFANHGWALAADPAA